MLESMDEGELDEWLAFHRLEPIGPDRMVRVLVNGFLGMLRSQGVKVSPEHIDPHIARMKRQSPAKPLRQTSAEQIAAVRMIAAATNAKVMHVR